MVSIQDWPCKGGEAFTSQERSLWQWKLCHDMFLANAFFFAAKNMSVRVCYVMNFEFLSLAYIVITICEQSWCIKEQYIPHNITIDYIHNWLVVSNMNFIFHFIYGIIFPIDELIFSRWLKHVKTTNQTMWYHARYIVPRWAKRVCHRQPFGGTLGETQASLQLGGNNAKFVEWLSLGRCPVGKLPWICKGNTRKPW